MRFETTCIVLDSIRWAWLGRGRRVGGDANTNRTKEAVSGAATVFTYNSWDQLTGYTGHSGSLTYDTRGNTELIHGVALAWDATNRNTGLTQGTDTITYTRDALDRITNRTQAGVTTTYLYATGGDGPAGLGNIAGGVSEWYVSLLGNVSRTVVPSGADTWLAPNIHGGTLAVVNTSGAVQGGSFVYDPWGQALTGSPDAAATTAEYGWLGQHQKATETTHDNIVQMGARLYHPTLGRFLTVDPVEGGTLNDYVYVHDPVNSRDLSGGGWLGDRWDDVNNGASAVSNAVGDAAGSVGSAAVSAGRWAHEHRSKIAAGLATVSLIVGTGGTVGMVLLGAAVTASAYDALHTCKAGDRTGCAVGVLGTATGGAGGLLARSGAAVRLVGRSMVDAGRVARASAVSRWGRIGVLRGSGAIVRGRSRIVAGTFLHGFGMTLGGVGYGLSVASLYHSRRGYSGSVFYW